MVPICEGNFPSGGAESSVTGASCEAAKERSPQPKPWIPCAKSRRRKGAKEWPRARTAIPPANNYFLYQKIANAIKATVIIHKIMSLLWLFSSGMQAVQHI